MPSISIPLPTDVLLRLIVLSLAHDKAHLQAQLLQQQHDMLVAEANRAYAEQSNTLIQEAGIVLPAGVTTYQLDGASGCLVYEVAPELLPVLAAPNGEYV